MQHFFVNEINWLNAEVGTSFILGEQAHHLRSVLRAEIGDELTIAYLAQIYQAEISAITKEKITLIVARKALPNPELPVDLILLQGLPKADKLEYIIMKACELGVAEIQPLSCDFCVSRDKKEKLAKLQLRRNEIALAACKQSHRAKLVSVNPTRTLNEALACLDADYLLFAYEKSTAKDNLAAWFNEHKNDFMQTIKTRLAENKRMRIAVLIGPEGGFSTNEVELVQKKAIAKMINLGSRILRTETAPVALLSYLMLEIENLTSSFNRNVNKRF